MTDDAFRDSVAAAALETVSAVFASLGRGLICLDHEFRIVHASASLDAVLGPGAAQSLTGRSAAEVLGDELFGPGGAIRLALLDNERREGWRASLTSGDRSVPVSVTAVPFDRRPDLVCDPRVTRFLMLRTSEDTENPSSAPTLFGGLISRSPRMHAIFRLVENMEQSEATVLIQGESGTGKELLARAIHGHSPRGAGPFVAVNCGALPHDLLESELFGHVRGAFTGAVRDRVGRFEMANGGTLFLDEVGDLPLDLQVKLLRVLQERTFERVGENRTRTSEARIVAASNVDLKRAVADGRFREDLFYRLRVVPIEMPPLRERREDVEALARHLLGRVGARQRRALRFSPDALRVLLRHPWPGNVRELENAIEYAVVVCKGQTVLPEDLPSELTGVAAEAAGGMPDVGGGMVHGAAAARAAVDRGPAPSGRAVAADAGEAARLRRVLEAHRWRRADAARSLGVSRSTLWRRMREAGLAR